MNLIDPEAFVAVVDHGSIVVPHLRILHLTQSAVTRRIPESSRIRWVYRSSARSAELPIATQPMRARPEICMSLRQAGPRLGPRPQSAIVHKFSANLRAIFVLEYRDPHNLTLTHSIGHLREGYPASKFPSVCTMVYYIAGATRRTTRSTSAGPFLPEEGAPPGSV